jgi:hypothetical protein
MTKVVLREIAYARSGDKGNSVNVGVIARSEEAYKFILQALTADKVKQYFHRLNPKEVIRYELPNLKAVNFIIVGALGGGGSRSLALDSQGKAIGQALLEITLDSSVERCEACDCI